MKNKFIKGLLVSSILAVSTQAATWKYAIEESITDVQGVYATKFKEYIEKNSDHKIKIYPYGTLGESVDVMEQAQAGILEFVDQSPGFTGTLIPEAQAFLLPYVFPENSKAIDNFFKNSKAINEMFPKLYAKQGLELLKMFPEGAVSITTQEPFTKPADLNGKKIRVMTSPLLVETYKEFGAVPTPLAWGEVYGSLQTKIIDGQENPMFWIESAKLYEVSEVITDIGHNIFTTAVMANKRFFDSLSKENKKLVKNASEYAFNYILDYQKSIIKKAKEKIKKDKPSIKFVTLTDEQREPFRKGAQKVYKKFVELTGKSGEKILNQMLEDLKEASK